MCCLHINTVDSLLWRVCDTSSGWERNLQSQPFNLNFASRFVVLWHSWVKIFLHRNLAARCRKILLICFSSCLAPTKSFQDLDSNFKNKRKDDKKSHVIWQSKKNQTIVKLSQWLAVTGFQKQWFCATPNLHITSHFILICIYSLEVMAYAIQGKQLWFVKNILLWLRLLIAWVLRKAPSMRNHQVESKWKHWASGKPFLSIISWHILPIPALREHLVVNALKTVMFWFYTPGQKFAATCRL